MGRGSRAVDRRTARRDRKEDARLSVALQSIRDFSSHEHAYDAGSSERWTIFCARRRRRAAAGRRDENSALSGDANSKGASRAAPTARRRRHRSGDGALLSEDQGILLDHGASLGFRASARRHARAHPASAASAAAAVAARRGSHQRHSRRRDAASLHRCDADLSIWRQPGNSARRSRDRQTIAPQRRLIAGGDRKRQARALFRSAEAASADRVSQGRQIADFRRELAGDRRICSNHREIDGRRRTARHLGP